MHVVHFQTSESGRLRDRRAGIPQVIVASKLTRFHGCELIGRAL
jgi:hypothetical protein